MELPRFVYKSPGSLPHRGETYTYKQVNEEGEFTEFIKSGWFPTREACFNPASFDVSEFIKENSNVQKTTDEKRPEEAEEKEEVKQHLVVDVNQTRISMEKEAEKLGVKFRSNTPDDVLMERIKLVKEV